MTVLFPILVSARSSIDASGYTFRGDNETELSSQQSISTEGLVFRGDAENKPTKQKLESIQAGDYSGYVFRPPRQRRTIQQQQLNKQNEACVEPGNQNATGVTPFSYPSTSPYLYPGYSSSYGYPATGMGNYGYPGNYTPRW